MQYQYDFFIEENPDMKAFAAMKAAQTATEEAAAKPGKMPS